MLKRVTNEWIGENEMPASLETQGAMKEPALAPVVEIKGLSLTYEAADGPVYALSDVNL